LERKKGRKNCRSDAKIKLPQRLKISRIPHDPPSPGEKNEGAKNVVNAQNEAI